MKSVFLNNNNTENLIVFFSGWGMDVEPFKNKLDKVSNADICICYDYNDMDLNIEPLKRYKHTTIIAWSLGVFAASFYADKLGAEKMIAINGTLFPIDDEKGISNRIFFSTLENLSEDSLKKFQRRMCGSRERFENFIKSKPKRDISSLKSELKNIGDLYMTESGKNAGSRIWDLAIIGENDMIFPAENQKRGWANLAKDIEIIEQPHYFDSIPLLDLKLYE